MKNRILALLLALAFVSCGSDQVHIKETNIGTNGEIAEKQNIMITFDRDLAPDSLISKWDSSSYFVIKPRTEGRYQWISRNTLSFSPAFGFEPNTEYELELTDKILKHGNSQLSLPDDKFIKFHTEFLRIDNISCKWRLPDSSASTPVLSTVITLNNAINPNSLDSLLEVEIAGKTIQYKIISTEITPKLSFYIPVSRVEDIAGETMKIKIRKGVQIAGSKNKSDIDLSEDMTIPTLDKLLIEKVVTSDAIEELCLKIATNQELAKNQDLKKLIKLKPEIDFTIRQTESGFNIEGNFDVSVNYELAISGDLKGVCGRPLTGEFKTQVSFKDVEPMLSFSSPNGMYLSSKGYKNLGVKIYGTQKITVTVVKVYENNILAFSKQGKSSNYEFDDYGSGSYGHSYEYYDTEEYGDVVFRKEYEVSKLGKNGNLYLLNLDFKDVIKNYDGIYVVAAEASDKKWLTDSRIVCLSDIGLVVKKTASQVLVFANSIKTGEAIQSAKVRLISSNNQFFASKLTDPDGIAIFDLDKHDVPNFKPKLVSVRQDNDLNYMILDSKTEVDNSKFQGIGGISGADYKTFLYGDRDLYRPDDTLTIAGIIRDEDWNPLRDIYIKAELLMPSAKLLKEMKILLNNEGGFAERVYLPPGIVTGIYSIKISLLNGTVLKTRKISVEEFMPDRIKVNLSSDREDYTAPDSIRVNANVMNMFGPPATSRSYEFNFTLKKIDFEPKEYKNYKFNIDFSSDKLISEKMRTGKTDKNGEVHEVAGISSNLRDLGLLSGTADLTVFDENNRTVSRNLKLNIYTQDIFIGIGQVDSYVGTNRRIGFPIVAVNKSGKLQNNAPVIIQVIKREWETVMRRGHSSRYLFESQTNERIVFEKEDKISGTNNMFYFRPEHSGRYELRVFNKGAKNCVTHKFYAYSWGSTQANDFEVNTEGKIDISMDMSKYDVGDKAKILFKTPFQGKMLVTIERDGIIEHRIINTDGRAAEMTIPLKKEFVPNIYVSATLIKALNSEDVPLTVAYGYASIPVEDESNILPLKITASPKARSKTMQKITVKTKAKKDIFVTVAAVDEGILQVKNFRTPDPYSFFYQKIGLDVSTFSIYPYLFPELKMQAFRTGASDGADYNLAKRLNPLTNKRVHLLALWSGVLKTNSKGEASWEIEIPEFSGAVRLMACAYNEHSFGSGETMMTVSDPIVLSSSLPRFLSPGDEIESHVTFTNTTNKKANIKATISTSGAARIVENISNNVTIEPESEKMLTFKLAANNQIGYAKVTVNAEGLGEKYSQTTDLTVRPASALQKSDISGVIPAGQSHYLSLEKDYFKESVSSSIIFSKSPMIEFSKNLKNLIEYPYGCLEQTVSTAFPQLALADILNQLGSDYDKNDAKEAARNVRYAIEKVQSMQMPNGGLTLWQGDYIETWWSSAYAGHFLIECRKAGYEINSFVLERLLNYLSYKTVNDKPDAYYTNSRFGTRETYSRESMYSLFVLALGGKPDIVLMNQFRSRAEKLTEDSKFMLAASYKLAGDKKSQNSYLPVYSVDNFKKESGGSFSSPTRDLALALYMLQIADPINPQITTLIHRLSTQMKNELYLSTQDKSFGLLALSRIMKETSANAKGELYLDEKYKSSISIEDKFIKERFSNQNVKLVNSGQGNLYYFARREGVLQNVSYTDRDNFIRVRRQFFNRWGGQIGDNRFKLGDMIVVKVTLESQFNENIDNIVITDLLPAGFEIENPRLGKTNQYDWIKDKATASHIDYRDDRINIFCNLGYNKKQQNFDDNENDSETNDEDQPVPVPQKPMLSPYNKSFYYIVRAVTKGKFALSQISADAMYFGEYNSYSGGGTVVINQ
ncbi:MAG: MG2 domain-containing protein [Candidatus Kapabacteria bacterium]|nr:MG2 domain-containing protein [Candidatus Kapabacteria bacterium]